MKPSSSRWVVVTPSHFAHEQEALEYLAAGLPDHEPYRIWSNFELISKDGTISEIDALVLVPAGLFLVEIKSLRGELRGDGATWRWAFDGKITAKENPRLLAERKAKRLKSALAACQAFKSKPGLLPFIQSAVFLSSTDIATQHLDPVARTLVFRRDRGLGTPTPVPGIEPLWDWAPKSGPLLGSATARALDAAIQQVGIKRSTGQRRVGDWILGEMLDDRGPWQEWSATHTSVPNGRARLRIYPATAATGSEAKASMLRAAQREFQILQGIDHPGILVPRDCTDSELGPALRFDALSKAQRLDHFLAEHEQTLQFETRLELLRDLVEIVDYAHRRRLTHRSLAPASILVRDPSAAHPALTVGGWHTGGREQGSSTTTPYLTATIHPDRLVDESTGGYVAPEVHTHVDPDGVRADVFSLGAIAYRLFSRKDPAANHLDLVQRLAETGHLDLPAVVDGCPVALALLVEQATQGDADRRAPNVAELLAALDELEDELTRPSDSVDPDAAGKGDRLGRFEVVRRLGQGSTAIAYLVKDGDAECVLKVARDPKHNPTLRDEASVLDKLRHHQIVELHGTVELGDRVALVLSRAGTRTLAEELREHGRLSIDFLERFGADLLEILGWLESKGISHRDIKPENLGIQAIGSSNRKHLVLFDFSLSRASLERIDLGTAAYLDPFLREPRRRRYDLAAERFAAALTLHEMATGQLPRWGSGATDPYLSPHEVTVEAELLDPPLRGSLPTFFARALARDARQRFDTSEEMLKEWRKVFQTLDANDSRHSAPESQSAPELSRVDPATLVADLGLSTRAFHALERLELRTAADLAQLPRGNLSRMRGVGQKTRQELTAVADALRSRFAGIQLPRLRSRTALEATPTTLDHHVEQLAGRLLGSSRGVDDTTSRALHLYLGLESEQGLPRHPNQTEVAQALGVTRARVAQILGAARARWTKTTTELTSVRADIAELLELRGGLATEIELAEALLASRGRGTLEGEAARSAALAVVRAASEVELYLAGPRWTIRRAPHTTLAALVREDVDPLVATSWAVSLGQRADLLASTDPLPSPDQVLLDLRRIEPPTGVVVDDARLVRLAAACSEHAEVSSRRELYPRGLAAGRALTLAAGALQGADLLTPAPIRERVAARYRFAEPLPDPPALDRLLHSAGIELTRDPATGDYHPPRRGPFASSTGTLTTITRTPPVVDSPEALAAKDFEQRLRRSAERGGWLALLTEPRLAHRIATTLTERPGVHRASGDQLFLDALRQAIEGIPGLSWEDVLAADAAPPESAPGRGLRTLLERVTPAIEQQLLDTPGTVLLTEPGLFGRWERLDLLERLRERLARPEPERALRSLWILIPSDAQSEAPRIHGKALPVVNPSEWTRVPRTLGLPQHTT